MDDSQNIFPENFSTSDMSDIDLDSLTAHSDMTGLDSIHEAKPYNESEIFAISHEYYQNKGIKAWSNQAGKIIPHKVGTNYQAALGFARLVKANLKNYSWNEKLNILECGAGSGRFSRHLLHAFKELEIANKCTLLITDYSKQNLDDIAQSSMLAEFEEDEDYRLVEFDIVEASRGTTLAGKRFNFGNIAAVYLHYVLDSLPLTILRNQGDKQEELNLSISRRRDQRYDVLENDFFQARLEINESWQDYKWQEQSEPERYYQEHFQQYYQHKKEDLNYPYQAMRAVDNLNRMLDDRAFLLSSDLLDAHGRRYAIVGNSVLHPLDSKFILDYQIQEGNFGEVLIEESKNLSRMLLSKSKNVIEDLLPVFHDLHIHDNHLTKYLQMEKALRHLVEGNDPNSLLMLLREFTKLAPYCSSTYRFWSEYYKMIGKENYAMEALEKAKLNDYWADL
ncbi:MAG: SAM-dependent methyltransferase [Candidatus Melainabacteria bacterium]|nr:SAM-dependent methyltransferase [Candidatus Melainabacteria bacterium]